MQPDDQQTSRRTVLRSVGSLGVVGIATTEITGLTQGEPGEQVKRITGHLEPDVQNWVYVPFDVEDDITELHVEYEYNKSAENLLDIGIFDSDGHASDDVSGFRGWSGGARTKFMLSRSEATPGYYPGEIQAGTWYIILGPYRVGAEGIDYTIDVTMRSSTPGPAFEPQPAPSTPVNETAGWYRGDLHLHTVHSDGSYTPADLVSGVVDAGLDFFVSTEHNTTTANQIWGKHTRPNLLIVNGEEVTTRAGHYGALGLDSDQWIDWRYKPTDDDLSSHVEQVHDVGGLAVANHPFCPYKGCDWRFGYEVMDAIEVWNGPWTWEDEAALQTWDRMLREGHYLPAVGASDAHDYDDQIGLPHTIVYASELGTDAILSGISSGNSYLARSDSVSVDLQAISGCRSVIPGQYLRRPEDAPIEVEMTVTGVKDATVTFHTQDSIVKAVSLASDSEQVSYTTNAKAAEFVRVEIRDSDDTMVGLTNPVFFESA
ncbi:MULTISPECIES: CehA/McbA family metallohydrolase [unclassified Haladaptatus]|uniref:CehA/McbA family metallohydrolase n=1 Tax=unclassified Haladaptatus TaxID=2622732 RepID=UPI00209C470F|nr:MULTISPECIES: CehA/McbA family metallohydrolase [unclassified Haladaptatus]MCO8244866.1 CehA/McbA family metallohydrolase [Haladaptatus sp. AB643]MCO8255621.1 CehA/McbA family metallohydrolase [Haladaptatus sp. AB618]